MNSPFSTDFKFSVADIDLVLGPMDNTFLVAEGEYLEEPTSAKNAEH
jgi:hypothetical protein